MPLLTAESLKYHFPDQPHAVVNNLSLSVEFGKLIQLVGRNGTGKTTALRLLAEELTPVSGRLQRSQGSGTMYLDQKAYAVLASELTVGDHIRAFRNDSDSEAFVSVIDQFGLPLQRLVNKFAGQLSGGERQIFALLCALGGRYDILLLDEFTSHLDDRSEAVAFELVAAALASKQIGVVLVSHRKVPLAVDACITMEE